MTCGIPTGPFYSYSQLEALWINAGGSQAMAPLMAAIAWAESKGGAGSTGCAAGEKGLWQINPQTWGSWATYDPLGNAKAAVHVFNNQGLGAWSTYNSGAYLNYMQKNVKPAHTLPFVTPAANPPQQAQTTGFSLNPANWILDLFSSQGFKDGLQRVGLVLFGGALILVGIFLLAGKQTISLVVPSARGGAVGGPVGSTTRRSEIHHYKHTVSDGEGEEE